MISINSTGDVANPIPRRGFDLGELANRLARKSATKTLSKRMLAFLDASSAHADLVFAHELVHAFIKQQELDGDHVSAINASLIAQTILLYARATVVSSSPASAAFASSSRRTFDVQRYMSDREKGQHGELKLLRHEAIAHFNRDTKLRGVLWAKEKLIVVAARVFGEAPRIGVVSTRLSFDQTIFDLVSSQVEIGLRILGEIWRDKHADCYDAFCDLADKFPEEAQKIESFEIDLRSYFTSEETYLEFIGEGKGVGRLHWNHRAWGANESNLPGSQSDPSTSR